MLRKTWRVALVLTMLCFGLTGLWHQAEAAAHGEYTRWALAGSGKSGTVAVPDNSLPAGTFTSNSTTLRVPTGKSTFLNESTPFGAEFGSSRDQGYLLFGTAAGNRQSTTTVTFDTPTPAGNWGFALGDIDADRARIIARGADGTTLTATDLGWQGGFNYCMGSPKPPTCTRGTETDKPTWDAGSETLIGTGSDTDGASGWFRPERSVKELSIEFSVQTGIPIGQLWIAAHSPVVHPPLLVDIIVENPGDNVEPGAEVCADLRRVLDGSPFARDAMSASGGTLSYAGGKLCWTGPVDPHRPVIITFPVSSPLPPHAVLDQVRRGLSVRCSHGGRCDIKVTVTTRKLCRAALGNSASSLTGGLEPGC